MHSISVITLAFNEEASLERVIHDALQTLDKIASDYRAYHC
jgi:hypothetical protein